MWWTWTAPGTGIVTIRTTDSSFDTVLAVYRGAALNSLIPVASGVGGPSSVTFYVAAGTVLQIAVDSRFGVQGTIVLRIEMTNVAVHLLPPVRVLPSRDFRLDLQSASGGSYLVQYSTNLTSWLDLTNLILGTSSISVTDTLNSATSPRRFYRVISP